MRVEVVARKKCPRCKGKGFRMLIAGPMILGSQGSPGGKARYDCRMCKGTGRVKKSKPKSK